MPDPHDNSHAIRSGRLDVYAHREGTTFTVQTTTTRYVMVLRSEGWNNPQPGHQRVSVLRQTWSDELGMYVPQSSSKAAGLPSYVAQYEDFLPEAERERYLREADGIWQFEGLCLHVGEITAGQPIVIVGPDGQETTTNSVLYWDIRGI